MNRPVALWICAALLGGAAGLNWRRSNISLEQLRVKSLVAQGFENEDEAKSIESLLNAASISKLDNVQVKLVAKYAKKSGTAGAMAIGVIGSCSTQECASQLVPTLKELLTTQPDRHLIKSIPEEWAAKGIDLSSLGIVSTK
jgi:hypothetical protein